LGKEIVGVDDAFQFGEGVVCQRHKPGSSMGNALGEVKSETGKQANR
jgi:hypothetical protein